MSTPAIQSLPYESNIYLSLSGVPATGVLPGQVVAKYRKQGSTTLSTKALSVSNWIEVGFGFYILKWDSQDTDTLGSFFFTLSGTPFDNFTFQTFGIIEPNIVPEPDTCVVTGSLRDVGGNVPQNTRISFRPVEFPAKYGLSIIQADPVQTVANVDGEFQVRLVRNSIVVVEIERAGIKHQITIPDQASADLTDLLPPFAIDFTT